MAETTTRYIAIYRGLFLLLVGALVFAALLPGSLTGRLPGPDVLFCLTFAWLLRRPDFVPVLMIALVFLLTDVMYFKPLGLWAAIVVVASEFVRRREASFRETSFLAEWIFIASVFTAMFVANAVILAFFGVDQHGFGLTVLQLIFTVLLYPLAVFASSAILGVRKLTPIQTDRMGRSR